VDSVGGVGERIDRIGTWRKDLSAELATLPDSLRRFREAISDLQRITERLEYATVGIETMMRHADNSGLTDAMRQLDQAAMAVEKQLAEMRDAVPGAGLVGQTVTELHRNIDSVVGLLSGRDRRADSPGGAVEG